MLYTKRRRVTVCRLQLPAEWLRAQQRPPRLCTAVSTHLLYASSADVSCCAGLQCIEASLDGAHQERTRQELAGRG